LGHLATANPQHLGKNLLMGVKVIVTSNLLTDEIAAAAVADKSK